MRKHRKSIENSSNELFAHESFALEYKAVFVRFFIGNRGFVAVAHCNERKRRRKELLGAGNELLGSRTAIES